MLNVRPVKPEHAINEVVFVLIFTQTLTEQSLYSLKQLEEQLQGKSFKMETREGSGVQIDSSGKIEAQPARLLSITFKHFTNKQQFDWALRAQENFLAINCLDYDGGWNKIWPQAHNLLKIAADKLVNTEQSIESLSLQYIDRFIYEGEIKSYKTSTILNDKSDYFK